MLVINASNIEKDFEWFKSHTVGDVIVKNVSDDYAQLALQGPMAEYLLQKLTDKNLNETNPVRLEIHESETQLCPNRDCFMFILCPNWDRFSTLNPLPLLLFSVLFTSPTACILLLLFSSFSFSLLILILHSFTFFSSCAFNPSHIFFCCLLISFPSFSLSQTVTSRPFPFEFFCNST